MIQIGEHGQGDEYGIGSDEAISILDLAKLFTDNIEMLPENPGNRMNATVETKKVKEEFGWETTMSVRDYVKDLVDGKRE